MLFIRYDQSDSSELKFQIRSRCKLISGSDILSLSVSDENSVEDDQVPSSAVSRSKQPVRISLHEVLLDLLQPLHRVCDLQVNLRPLKMVSNDCLCPKTFVWTPEPCL